MGYLKFCKLTVLSLVALSSCAVMANPVLSGVAAGNISIQQSPNVTTINQSSQRAIINWNSFNIGQNQATHFIQPAGGSALNRINPSQGASQIFGALTATGQIILINPAGIYVGPNAYISAGSLIATTSNINDRDFMQGHYQFSPVGGYSGSIINDGTIVATNHGLVALIGSNVTNNGLIQANLGHVIEASGDAFTMSFAGDDLVSFAITKPSAHPHVTNNGSLVAEGGQILVTAAAAQGTLDNVISMNGIAEAKSIYQQNGSIIISGDPNGGTVSVSAKLNASGKKSGQTGGYVSITGYNLEINSPTTINVSGDVGGGTIRIGKDTNGNLAHSTAIQSGVRLLANTISSGNGGLVETSGEHLSVDGLYVNTSTPNGHTGTWLLDPADLTICSSCTTTATSLNGTYSAGSTNSNILVSNLVSSLASTNITLQTTNSGTGGNGDIFVNAAISWSSGNTLTLSAYRNITVNSTISNTGGGSVVLQADNTGTGIGTVAFAAGKNVTLSGGSGTVKIYYNPATFGTQDSIYTSGTTPIQFMLINSLGSASQTGTSSLASLSNTSSLWNQNFALGANIDASATRGWNTGAGFSPIGNTTTSYSGLFDGLGHIISNLYINQPTQSNIGLFGKTNSNASITNVGVSSVVTGADSVGGLVGSNAGAISNDFSAGAITGTSDVGGLVGMNSGSINNAYSTSSVSNSGSGSGGLVGQNSSTGIIDDAYATGNTTGNSNVGGLVGINTGAVQNSFWDTDTTGVSIGVGSGSGSTTQLVGGCFGGTCLNGGTVDLTELATLNGASWNTSNTWDVISGQSYPYLRIFYPTAPRAISGQIAQFTAYLDNPNWAPMTQTEKNPLWSSLTPDLIGNQQVTLAANGTIIDKTYSGANGFYYFLESKTAIPDSSPLLAYLSNSSNKSNTITVAPAGGASISNLYLALNTVLASDNGVLNFGYQFNINPVGPGQNFLLFGLDSMPTIHFTFITNDDIAHAVGNLSGSDILYSASGSDINVNNNYNFFTSPNSFFDLVGNLSTTNGSITFGGPVQVGYLNPSYNANVTVKTNSGGNIANMNQIVWPVDANDSDTLNLDSANNIVLEGSVIGLAQNYSDLVSLSNGSLTLSAAFTNQSITTGPAQESAIVVNIFNLLQGKWYQQYSPFAFDNFPANYVDASVFVVNDFRIASGNLPSSQAEFIRVFGGNGTPASPYQLIDATSLQGIGSDNATLAASWIMTTDAFMVPNYTEFWNNGAGFTPIGSLADPFTGSFDGNYHLNSSTPLTTPPAQLPVLLDIFTYLPNQDNVGIFGATSSTATISNIGYLFNTGVTGHNNVGLLVGYNQGLINNVYLEAADFSIGNNNVGMLVGVNTGTIENVAEVSSRELGNMNVGGIAGVNQGLIKDVIVTNYIGGTSVVGGIAGVNTGTIQDSFWNASSTGQASATGSNSGTLDHVNSGCLTGTCSNGSTVNLTNKDTYLSTTDGGFGLVNTSWDFTNIWGITPGYSYPYSLLTPGFGDGPARVISGTFSPAAANQLYVGTTSGHFNFGITGADGSFYAIWPSNAGSLHGGLTDNNVIGFTLTGGNVTGTAALIIPHSSSTTSGSVANINIATTPESGPTTNTLSIDRATTFLLFQGLNINQIETLKSNPNSFFNLTFTELAPNISSTDSELQSLYSYLSSLNINYAQISSEANYLQNTNQLISNYLLNIGIESNVKSLLNGLQLQDKQLLNAYDLKPIETKSCK